MAAGLRIRAVIPTPGWANSAGVRIRYQRIAWHLAALGHQFEIVPIETLETDKRLSADVYLFCKCQDLRSVVLAGRLRAAGRLVGVDLFDNSFTQTSNSRFTHLRDWLTQILPFLSFGICATPAMQTALARIAPDLPSHVMNDPFGQFDPKSLAGTLDQTAKTARARRHIPIGWFGTGDNPHLSVGLEDLAALGGALAGFAQAGYSADLTILTNRRAMTPSRLQMLTRLPLPWRIEDWSEAAETALISQSLVCLLPVNAQSFSTVKSLNRAVSTLSAGAQVLSLGYPLYAPLEAFVYRDVPGLLADLEGDRLRLRPDTLPALEDSLAAIGDPRVEAGGLVAFLSGLHRPATQPVEGAAGIVIQGVRSAAEVHAGLQRLGQLTVANPFLAAKLPCDLIFEVPSKAGQARVRLSARARAALVADLAGKVTEAPGPDGQPGAVLTLGPEDFKDGDFKDAPGAANVLLAAVPPLRKPPRRLDMLARYEAEMARLTGLLNRLYPGRPVLISEQVAPYRRAQA